MPIPFDVSLDENAVTSCQVAERDMSSSDLRTGDESLIHHQGVKPGVCGLNPAGHGLDAGQPAGCLSGSGKAVRVRGGLTRFIVSTHGGADLTEPMTGEDVIGLDRQDVAQMADGQVRLTDPEERNRPPRVKEKRIRLKTNGVLHVQEHLGHPEISGVDAGRPIMGDRAPRRDLQCLVDAPDRAGLVGFHDSGHGEVTLGLAGSWIEANRAMSRAPQKR